MFTVHVDIIRWVDDTQPGVVACRLVDAWGREHTLIDKLPIFTAASLEQHCLYPQPGWLACRLIQRRYDPQGRAIITIDTEQPWHVVSTTGMSQFEVLSEQLMET